MIIRFPAHYAGILMPLVLSILMTFVVSGVATLKNLGPAPGFVTGWMSAWGISWLIAFPTLLCALPVTRRIVQALVKPA
ncbi:DUF2798 domain-containing protein [Rhizobium oryzicola]|uniref:DUF2798 domain-containing protein n=1 Tax=Rhizobium oryzicola TaxID=1232668 RepID=A0ABT8SVB6_9HYPH|nr:DUF2798 domain-containing protein [Rhizobium oryzicola]MDO1582385.1 DUF2798 domain-containing protein [Rhizobium oryzicola]